MSQDLDRVYTIPLGKVLLSPDNQRAKRAINMIKEFARKHMKINDVRIDEEVSKLVWARGMRRPPRKIRVRMERTEEKHILITRYDERDDLAGAGKASTDEAAGAGTAAAAPTGAAVAAAGAPALEAAGVADAGADRLGTETAVSETAASKGDDDLADKADAGTDMDKDAGVDADGMEAEPAKDAEADAAPAGAGEAPAEDVAKADGAGDAGGESGNGGDAAAPKDSAEAAAGGDNDDGARPGS